MQHLARRHVQRREQIDRPVTAIVMGQRLGPAGHHRQRRLCAIQGLALGFLVETEHRRPLRRIDIQPDDIDQFLLERRVGRQFEGSTRLSVGDAA